MKKTHPVFLALLIAVVAAVGPIALSALPQSGFFTWIAVAVGFHRDSTVNPVAPGVAYAQLPPPQDCDGLAEPIPDDCDSDGWIADHDGFYDNAVEDCNEVTAVANPGQPEDCSIFSTNDNDCDGCRGSGSIDGDPDCGGGDCDFDGDGYDSEEECNNLNAEVNPGAQEVCDNDVDDDCDGDTDDNDADCPGAVDDDGDGFSPPEDCNDNNAEIFPGAGEAQNGLDDNCNQFVDEILGGQLFATGEEVVVTLLPSTGNGSGTASDLCLLSPGARNCFVTVPPHSGGSQQPPIGQSFTLGSFPAGTELLFGIENSFSSGPLVLGPACRNAPNAIQGLVQSPSAGEDVTVGFEDLSGGGDRDFEDIIFSVSGVTTGGPTTAVLERCNGIDDDCSGDVDNEPTDEDQACTTAGQGECRAGVTACSGGVLSCQPNQSPSDEVCDGLDNDCDGLVDEGTGGAACDTGQPGVCGAGAQVCINGSLSCQPDQSAGAEVCGDSLDNDCDGAVDDGCTAACATEVSVQMQATRSSVKKNKTTGRYVQTVTLKNTGGSAIAGPIALALDNLNSNATLFNKSGDTSCATPVSPYIKVNVGANNVLRAGKKAKVKLEFTNPSDGAITYDTRVLAGTPQ